MTREEIINGLEIYTVGRLKKNRVHITVEELQKFIDAIKALEREESALNALEDIKAEIEDIDGITEIGAQILDEVLGIINRKITEVTNG